MVPLWCKLTIFESYMNYSCTLCLLPKFGISNCFRMLLVYAKFRRQTECFMSRKEECLFFCAYLLLTKICKQLL